MLPTKRLWRFLTLSLALLLLGACVRPLSDSNRGDNPELSGEVALPSPEALQAHVKTLSSDLMEGRQAGTAGADRAADYIAAEFQRIGLKPGGDTGGYLQHFEVVTALRVAPETSLTLAVQGSGRSYRVGKDFTPFSLSEDGTVEEEVVFAGYGITAPELHYDDYQGVDVTGKVVLVMTHEPREQDPQSPFRKPEAFRYTELRYKVLNAREHGARGIIVARDPGPHPGEGEELFAIRGTGSASASIVAVNTTVSLADQILGPSGQTLAGLQQQIDQALAPRSFPVSGVRVTITTRLIRERGRTANVVGILPGTDPVLAREGIVIGAHYDHLGRGGESSLAPDRYGTIHPGADDNASGTAGVMALAQAFSAYGRAKRTLIFAAFSAEEMGLLGSSQYVKAAPWPLDRTVAMLNMDMIGRLHDGKLSILGVDTGKEFRQIIDRTQAGLGLTLRLGNDGVGPSDHTPFYTKERPVLFVFTGAHSDYHRPSDTWEKLNYPGMRTVLGLVYRVIAALANSPGGVQYVRVHSSPPQGARGGGGYGPYFGVIPDFSESTVPGVLLSGVRAGSPAERAGLKAGDVIVKFGGVAVKNLEDLTFALRGHRPGDRVEVLFLRGGAEQRGEATLEQRR